MSVISYNEIKVPPSPLRSTINTRQKIFIIVKHFIKDVQLALLAEKSSYTDDESFILGFYVEKNEFGNELTSYQVFLGSPKPLRSTLGRAKRAHMNSNWRSQGVRGMKSPYRDLFKPIFINNPSMVFCASRLLYGDMP